MRDLRAGLGNSLAWLVGKDRQRAAWSLSLLSVTPGSARSGNAVKPSGLAAPVGKALALLENRSLWGGIDWLAADALVGQVDHEAENVTLKDTADSATPGAAPWLFKGDGRNIRMAKPNEGVVVRGASIGADFWRDHVFFPAAARLVAHHRPEHPPINSTQVFDPGEGDGDWQAGLHGAVRVRPWLDAFCHGATVVPGAPDPFALLLNFTKSAGDNSGWGSVHHAAGEGVLSQEANGPLRFGAPKHRLGQTSAADVRAESIDLNAFFGDGTDNRTGPKEYVPAPWQNGARGPIVMRVEHRFDLLAKHPFRCGERDGVWKWQSWSLFQPTEPRPPIEPPPRRPPGEPPEDPPTDTPPGIPTFGSPADFPDSPFDDPETAPGADTPEELETPSVYGHARPHPDQPRKPVTGHTGEDGFWMARYGCTARERAAEPIVAHMIFLPELVAAGGESVKSRLAEFGTTDDGAVAWRKPALGGGSLFVAPSNVQDYQTYITANGAMLPAAPNDILLAVLAGKSGSTTVDGRLGLGSALAGTPFIASGFEFRLNTTPSSTTPDLQIAGKNASAADASAGRVQLLNPLALPAEALPGSPLTGQLAIDSGATNALKWWDGAAWQSAGGGGGEANTASNVGGGVGVFQTKVGVDLQFHSLVGIDGAVAIGITDVGDTIEIAGTLGWPLNAPETGTAYSFDNTTSGSNLAGMGFDQDTLEGPKLTDITGAAQLIVTTGGVTIPNKLTVVGGIDPIYLEFAAAASNGGGTPAKTIYIDDGTNYDAGSFVFGTSATPVVAPGVFNVGSIGTEQNSVPYVGTTQAARAIISDQNDAYNVLLNLHKHSTGTAFTDGGLLAFSRSRSTGASHGALNGDDYLGSLLWAGHDGTDYNPSARISVRANSAFNSNDSPGYLDFDLSPEGSNVLALVMRLNADKSVYFANTLEIGHASDTTLARSSAGNLSIEGNLIYRAGGTDVPITDGGTGSSTADGALENLIDGATVQTAALDLTTDEIAGRDVSAASPDGRAIVLQDIGGLFAPSTNDFRLTGTTATPVMTADSTALSTIYLTPYKGNRIALYDTSNSKWKLLSSAEVSLAVTGRTTDLPFDIFAYNNSGTVTLEFLDWASATARSTAIARQDGVWTKSGDASRRYLGTCRPRSATSFHWVMHGNTAGTAARIDLWNMDNRVDIACEVLDATNTWTYTTETWRQVRASAINQIDYVCGIAEDGGLVIAHGISSTNNAASGAAQRWTGIGLDSTSAPATYSLVGSVDSGSESLTSVAHELSSYGHYAIAAAQLSIGRHYLAWLEKSEASGTTTWYGDDAGSGGQAGILFRWRA